MKKLGIIAVWIVATGLATVASVTAVRLVGAEVSERPVVAETAAAITPTIPPTNSESAGQASTGGPITLPGSTTVVTSTPLDSGSEPGAGTSTASPIETTTTTGLTSATTTPPTSPTTTPTTTASTTPTSTPTSTIPTPSTTTTTVAPTTGPFTFAIAGGSVTVTCSGDAASLSGAVPTAGYSADVKTSGPEEVRVEFSNEAADSEIRVRCNAGQPIVEIDED